VLIKTAGNQDRKRRGIGRYFQSSVLNVVPAAQYGMSADIPLEMLVTVTFEEHEGKTTLTLQHVGIPAGAERDGAYVGWNQSLDKLAEAL
jgi:uncharacterized protein YndB with AHSA1/START domain